MSHSEEQLAALSQIKTIAETAGLSRQDVMQVFNDKDVNDPSMLQRVMSYIGGAFVFVGICVYVGIVWEDLDSLARVIITLGSGFVAFILGLFAIGDQRFVRASTPLFLIAAGLQPAGLFVFMDEYLPSSNNYALAAAYVFGFMTVQQAIAFAACKRTSLLFFALFFYYLFTSALFDLLDVDSKITALALGVSGVAASWIASKTRHEGVSPFYFFCGGVAIAAAAFDYLEDTPYDVLLIGVVALMILVSVLASSRSFLTISIISLLCYLAYYTDEYFKDVVGWPIALVIIGLIMIGVSSAAVKLGRKMSKPNL